MKSIESILSKVPNKKLLVVFPHPDDESVMAGGLILRALSMGWQVSVLTLTEGGRGKIYIHGKGRSAQEIRRAEMARAMARLGVVDWVMWSFDDGKLRREKGWRVRLKKFMEITDPGLVVSYDLSGVTGHPDHVALALEILRMARKRRLKLLWPSFSGKEKKMMVERRVEKFLQEPEYELSLGLSESWRKWRAAFAHVSQNLAGFVGMPWWIVFLGARCEWYAEMKQGKKYRYRYVKFRI